MRSVVMLLALPSLCQGMVVVDPGDIAQNAATSAHTIRAYYEQVQTVENTAQEIKNQVTMLKGLKLKRVEDVTDDLDKVADLANEGQSLTYANKELSTQFDKNFGSGDAKHENAVDRANSRLQTVLDTSKSTLTTAQEQMQYNRDETDGLSQITNASNDAEGLRGVMQGTTQMLDANAAQIQRLTAMQAQKDSQDAVIAAQKAAQEKAANDADKKFLSYKNTYKPYQADPALEQIPNFNQ